MLGLLDEVLNVHSIDSGFAFAIAREIDPLTVLGENRFGVGCTSVKAIGSRDWVSLPARGVLAKSDFSLKFDEQDVDVGA